MEKTGIINFSEYSKDKKSSSKKPNFNKGDFDDFFINNNDKKLLENAFLYNSNIESNKEEDDDTIVIQNTTLVPEEENNEDEDSTNVESNDDDIEEDSEEEEEVEETEEIEKNVNSNDDNANYYSIYKDKSEDFSCDIFLEGASLDDTEARLIIECDDWTLMFKGTINNNGKCNITIKKLSILNEGCTGKIKLEVIADGSIFTPWEDTFKVKISKKVSVKVQESKSNIKKPVIKKPFISGIKIRSKN